MSHLVEKFVRAAILGAALAGPAQGQSVEPTKVGAPEAVASALDKLDAWLGDGDNGDRWRAYLHTAQLRTEVAKGQEADPSVAAYTLGVLHGEANGLTLAPFQSAADAIDAWLLDLRDKYENDLPKLAWASRGDHRPITAKQFEEIRTDLRSKAQALDAALARDPKNAAGWKSYLHWDSLEPHLAEGFQPDAKSLAALDEVLERFRTNQVGLERPEFTKVAKAIAKYRALANWAGTARVRDSRPVYERYLADVQRLLERQLERPTIEVTRQIARGVGVIDGLGQSPQLVRAVREHYAHPNVFGAVSNEFLTRAPGRNIDRITPVRDCILGTSIFGSAHTCGTVRYDLLPSEDSVELAVYLDGTAHSNTRGFNGPVRINSTGTTTYWAHQRISISDDEFRATSPSGNADTHTRIRSIQKTGGQFGHRLIEKIAWKRAGQQKRQAEKISSQHTRKRVLTEFEETVARDLGASRLRYENEIRAPLVRRGVSPEFLRMSSSPQGVIIETLFATRAQLGAFGPPPPMMPGHDFALQIHESAVNNYLPLALSSARISQEKADQPPDLQGNVPNWLKLMSIGRPKVAAAASAGVGIVKEAQERVADVVGAEPEDEDAPPAFKPYSITLNSEAPASAHFDDGKISIRVRAAVLASDERVYKNWDFIVTYLITQVGDRIVLQRLGEIEVLPTGFDTEWPTQLTAEQTSFRSVLKRNMNDRANAGQSFPKEIPIEPVRLSRFGALVLRELVADDGWLTAGWGLPSLDSPAAAAQPLPLAAPATATSDQ